MCIALPIIAFSYIIFQILLINIFFEYIKADIELGTVLGSFIGHMF